MAPERAAVLGQFFSTSEFGRLAVVVSNQTLLEGELPPYRIAAREVIERIARFAARSSCDGVAMIVEESQRTDRLAAAFFSGYDFEFQQGAQRITLPFLKFRMPKSAAEGLLEVADFIIHVAGSQVRNSLNGRGWGRRRDFQSVFFSNSDPRVEFLEILEAKFNPQVAQHSSTGDYR